MKTKSNFYQKVGKSRKAMIEFLENHFRYDTMNSWNRSISYANKVKVHSVIPSALQNKVYEMLEAEGFYDNLNWLLEDFAVNHGQQWQAGFNGRSGGYIVLYEGKVETKTIFTFSDGNDRDYADGYGWLSLAEAKKRGLYKKQIQKVSTYAGRSVDGDADFSDWGIEELKARVELVQDFDKMCDDVVNETIRMATENTVEEETYTVTKTRKVLA